MKIPKEQIPLIARKIAAGATLASIAEEWGCHPTSIRRLLARHGLLPAERKIIPRCRERCVLRVGHTGKHVFVRTGAPTLLGDCEANS
jgi:hypothetical protein